MVFMAMGILRIGIEGYFDFTVLEYTMIIIAVLGIATAIQRAVLAWRKI